MTAGRFGRYILLFGSLLYWNVLGVECAEASLRDATNETKAINAGASSLLSIGNATKALSSVSSSGSDIFADSIRHGDIEKDTISSVTDASLPVSGNSVNRLQRFKTKIADEKGRRRPDGEENRWPTSGVKIESSESKQEAGQSASDASAASLAPPPLISQRGKIKFGGGDRAMSTDEIQAARQTQQQQQQPPTSTPPPPQSADSASRSSKYFRQGEDGYVFESPYPEQHRDDASYDRYFTGEVEDNVDADVVRNYNPNGPGFAIVNVVKKPQGFVTVSPTSALAPISVSTFGNSPHSRNKETLQPPPPPPPPASPVSSFYPRKRPNHHHADVNSVPSNATRIKLADSPGLGFDFGSSAISKNEILKKPSFKLNPASVTTGGVNGVSTSAGGGGGGNRHKLIVENSLPATSTAWALASMKATNGSSTKLTRQPVIGTSLSSNALSKKIGTSASSSSLLDTENVFMTHGGSSSSPTSSSGNANGASVKPFIAWSTRLHRTTTEQIKDWITSTKTTTLSTTTGAMEVESTAHPVANPEQKVTKSTASLTESGFGVLREEGERENATTTKAITSTAVTADAGAPFVLPIGLEPNVNTSNDILLNDVDVTFGRDSHDKDNSDNNDDDDDNNNNNNNNVLDRHRHQQLKSDHNSVFVSYSTLNSSSSIGQTPSSVSGNVKWLIPSTTSASDSRTDTSTESETETETDLSPTSRVNEETTNSTHPAAVFPMFEPGMPLAAVNRSEAEPSTSAAGYGDEASSRIDQKATNTTATPTITITTTTTPPTKTSIGVDISSADVGSSSLLRPLSPDGDVEIAFMGRNSSKPIVLVSTTEYSMVFVHKWNAEVANSTTASGKTPNSVSSTLPTSNITDATRIQSPLTLSSPLSTHRATSPTFFTSVDSTTNSPTSPSIAANSTVSHPNKDPLLSTTMILVKAISSSTTSTTASPSTFLSSFTNPTTATTFPNSTSTMPATHSAYPHSATAGVTTKSTIINIGSNTSTTTTSTPSIAVTHTTSTHSTPVVNISSSTSTNDGVFTATLHTSTTASTIDPSTPITFSSISTSEMANSRHITSTTIVEYISRKTSKEASMTQQPLPASTSTTTPTSTPTHTSTFASSTPFSTSTSTPIPTSTSTSTLTSTSTSTPTSTSTFTSSTPLSTSTSTPTPTSTFTSTTPFKPKIGANNIPGYLKLVFKTTVADICETSTLKENLFQFITQRSLRVQSKDQVVMMIDPQECKEPSHSTRSIPVALYVVDEFGSYDKSLIDEMKLLLEDENVGNYTLPIHEIVFRENVPNTSRVIAAIVITSIAAVCFVLLVFLMCAIRNRQKTNYGQRCTPVSVDDYNLDNISEYNNSIRRHRGNRLSRMSKRSYGNPVFDDPVSPSRTLNLHGLCKAIETRSALDDEFAKIPTITVKADELPVGAEIKNRYANVIPLPETRVSLNASNCITDAANDYINANYVKGFEGAEKFYVACQAPLADTIQDFWKMVWKEQTKIIIMLTGLTENGVEKCADYLPPSEVLDCHRLFGDYQVTLKKREVKEKYVISLLQLKNMETNLWREVTHFWYTNWPAQGVPDEQSSIIALLIEARAYMRNGKGAHVVHCSPGTGRTGTVIAIDICIRNYESNRTVNVPATVSAIRRCRAGAVQTKEQYAFIYKVLALYAKKLNGGGTSLDSM